MKTKKNRLGYVYDPVMTLHQASIDHPEKPERIQRIYQKLLNDALIDQMIAVKSREITMDETVFAHKKHYLDCLEWKLRGPRSYRK
jgi:histone deacetylase 6